MANSEIVETIAEPIEGPKTEISSLVADENPETALARLEKIAALAPRWEQAIRTILMASTLPEDWEIFGQGDKAKACLSSAGAMRVAKHFPIKFFETKWQKETWTDRFGQGYRYIYEGKATLGERIVYAQGSYSSRDKFLGKVGENYRDLSDIPEGNIQNAANHIYMGNAVKELLGLRAMPLREYNKLMGLTGQDAKKTPSHSYGAGTKGGTTSEDKVKQKELAELCIAIATAGSYVELNDAGEPNIVPQDPELHGITDPVAVGKEICETLSSFKGNEGKQVKGLPASKLKGKRLDISLEKARKLAKSTVTSKGGA